MGIRSNERLEFLGDTVLGLVTAEYLFRQHPDLPEGDLTRIRAALVCEESLYEVAQKLGLGQLSEAGQGRGGRRRPAAGVHPGGRHGGGVCRCVSGRRIAAACSLIHRVLLDKEREEDVEERRRDYKTELQELVQREPNRTLVYRMAEESGPDHDKTFTFEVRSTARSSGAAKDTAKRKPSRWPARRWSGWNKKTTVGLARRFSFT